MDAFLRNGENTVSLEPLIRAISYTLVDCGVDKSVSYSTKSTNLSRAKVLNSKKAAEGTNTSMVYKPSINDKYPTNLTDDQNNYIVKTGTSLDLYICSTSSSTAVTSTVTSTNYNVCLKLTLPPIKCHYTSGSTHYNAPITTTIKSLTFKLKSPHPFSGSSWKYTTSQYAYSFTGTGIAWNDPYGDAQNVTVSGVTTGQGIIYLSRHNLDCAGIERIQTSGYNAQSGWVECYLTYKAEGSISGTTVTYEIDGTTPLKVRIIKLLTNADFGDDRFFIGTKCPSEIYITNASNVPTKVREVWLGNVKVWPFNGNSTITSPTVKMQLRLKGFKFYSYADQNTLLGTINDGSVYASIRYTIAKTDASSNNVYYDNYKNTCKIREKYICPWCSSTYNTRICLSTTGSKTIEWTWNTGNSDWYHSTSCSGQNCENYLSKNVSPFDELKIHLNFLLPCPKLSSSYSSASSDSFQFFGESNSRTNIARGKFGGKLYSLSTIYKIASKEVYDNISLIANGYANLSNGTYISNKQYTPGRGELGVSTVYTTYLGNVSTIIDNDIYVIVKLPVENSPGTVTPPSSTNGYETPGFGSASLIGSYTVYDEEKSSIKVSPLSGSKTIGVSVNVPQAMTSGSVSNFGSSDTGNATATLTYYRGGIGYTCPSTEQCDLSIVKTCQTSHLEYSYDGGGSWTKTLGPLVSDVKPVPDTTYYSGGSKGYYYGKPVGGTNVSDISFEVCLTRVKHIEQVALASPSYGLWGGMTGWNYKIVYVEYISEDTAYFIAYQTVNGTKCAIGSAAVTGEGGSYSG